MFVKPLLDTFNHLCLPFPREYQSTFVGIIAATLNVRNFLKSN